MTDRGFSVVELLVALAVSALLWGAVAAVLPAWHAAFETTPAAIELQERSMVGLATLTAALRTAGGADVGTTSRVPLSSVMPVVTPLSAGASGGTHPFAGVAIVSAVPGGGQGRLAIDQSSRASALTIGVAHDCPHVADVCGFRPGVTAAIVDRFGRYDVFVVGGTDAASARIVPALPLSAPYRAGAAVVEVEASEYRVQAQPDGSAALTRVTAAGATQPVVDGVTRLTIDAWAEAAPPAVRWEGGEGFASYGPVPPAPDWMEPSGTWAAGESCVVSRSDAVLRTRFAARGEADRLASVDAPTLADGPWCPSSAGAAYDADLLRVRRVDITLGVEVLSAALRGPAGALFARPGWGAQAAIRWVPDRTITMSVSLRNEP